MLPKTIKSEAELKGSYLTVSKIKAQAPIIFGVDPFNEGEYKKALKRGVAHAKGTPLPGERGSVFIFAHSSGNPIEIASYNTIFFRLGELEKGDEVEIKKDGKIYRYAVVDKKNVWPNEVRYLTEQTKDQLILQTCWPVGTTLKRLLVFAEAIS